MLLLLLFVLSAVAACSGGDTQVPRAESVAAESEALKGPLTLNLMAFGGQGDMCLAEVGSQLQLAPCGPGRAQVFFAGSPRNFPGTGAIRASNGLCVTYGVDSNQAPDGSVYLAKCDNAYPVLDQQTWIINGGQIGTPPLLPPLSPVGGCLHVASSQSGASVSLAPCDGSSKQEFWASGSLAPYAFLVGTDFAHERGSGSGKGGVGRAVPNCLTVLNDVEIAGTPLDSTPCSNSNAQWFILNGFHQITLASHPSLCVARTAPPTGGHAPVALAACDTTAKAQQWYFADNHAGPGEGAVIGNAAGGCLELGGMIADATTCDGGAAAQAFVPTFAAGKHGKRGCSGTHCAEDISYGGLFVCAVVEGGVECWGDNDFGELGIGNSTGPETCALFGNVCSTKPVHVPGLANVVSVAAGGVDDPLACALLSDGTLRCWGENTHGGLGIGSSTGPSTCSGAAVPCATTPVAVPGLSGVVQVSVGGSHVCALLGDGSVWCWGNNRFGQLGNGNSTGPESCGSACSTSPIEVGNLSNVVSIATAYASTCALLNDGTVQCWGDDSNGLLGNGSFGPDTCDVAFMGGLPCATTPVPVQGLSGIVEIASAGGAMCALSSSGTVQCWGSNFSGDLGDGSTGGPSTCTSFPCSVTPVPVAGLTDVISLGSSSCALSRHGAVHCWGSNQNGELAIGNATGPEMCSGGPCSTTPVAVRDLTHRGVVQISGTCARFSDGTVMCWGSNTAGELGNGTSDGPALCPTSPPNPCSTRPLVVSL
jgi:alpha-tubulin suppressor-like RCC1 family protein